MKYSTEHDTDNDVEKMAAAPQRDTVSAEIMEFDCS